MGQNIMLTGGSGFIGSHVSRSLVEHGHKVINLDVKEPAAEAKWWLQPVADQIKFVKGGVDELINVIAAVKAYQPDAIIHTAAVCDLSELAGRHDIAIKVNLIGTLNILEAARIFSVKRLIYFSSIAVLPSLQYEPIDVNHPVFLATEGPGEGFYGAGKVASEALCWAYKEEFGLDLIIIRPSAVYGVGQGFPIFIKPMVENSVNGLPTRFETGKEFPRDYTHVDDITQLAVKAVELSPDKVKDRVFYGATGQPLVTAGEVADTVKELIPDADIEIGSGLSEQDLIEIRYRGVLSIKNAQEHLGFKPKYANIHDGIANYIETYRRYISETSR
ncbi:MAG: NAD(P)-dependent oxidoreductase [Spirochaetota bacterium]|nr:MAG: NAD(P)-dependent oxidoreductase [Spirochaetota bacterium]